MGSVESCAQVAHPPSEHGCDGALAQPGTRIREVLRAILKTGSGSALSLLFGIITVKLVAYRAGASALGSFSLLKQFVLVGSAMFITGGQTALVQGISVRDGKDRAKYAGTALLLLCGVSLLVGVVAFIVFCLSPKLIAVAADRWVAVSMGLAIALSGPTAFVFGMLNGVRRIGRLAIAQSTNALALAGCMFAVISRDATHFTLLTAVSVAISQLPGLILGTVFLRGYRPNRRDLNFDAKSAGHLTKLGFAAVCAASLQATTILTIRSTIASERGLGTAGVFDAGWTISMVYVMLILSSFSTYYLPTLASAGESANELINVVLRACLLLVVPLITTMVVLRAPIIRALYSAEFLGATRMMHWMMLGDLFKVLSFVVAMPMVAFADMKAFLWGEIGWNLSMGAGAQWIIRRGLQTEWLGLLFALCYLGYLVYAWMYCSRRTGWRCPTDLRYSLLTGLILIIGIIVLTRETTTSFGIGAVVCAGCVLHVGLLVRGKHVPMLTTGARA